MTSETQIDVACHWHVDGISDFVQSVGGSYFTLKEEVIDKTGDSPCIADEYKDRIFFPNLVLDRVSSVCLSACITLLSVFSRHLHLNCVHRPSVMT